MVDPTEREKAAMKAGGALGGEYLEHLGKTDLMELSADEYEIFIESVVTGYTEELGKTPPF